MEYANCEKKVRGNENRYKNNPKGYEDSRKYREDAVKLASWYRNH